MTTLQRTGIQNPIRAAFLLLLAALALRLIDIFILRLDEILGEIILSKSLGLLLVIGFALLTWGSLRPFAFRREGAAGSILFCGAVTTVALCAGYAAELLLDGGESSLVFAAIDPKAGVAGGLLFAAWLVFGNVVNALMEEGLFRGAIMRLFCARMLPFWANFWQALLFGLWHIVWAVKAIVTGEVETTGGSVMIILLNFLPQLMMGFVWGVYVLRSGNMWGAAFSHFLINSALNLFHTQAASGMDGGMSLRMAFVMTICSVGAWWLARRGLPKSLPFDR